MAAARQVCVVAGAGHRLALPVPYLLALVEAEHAGRSYATYGGVYILAALSWLWLAEGVRPDRWDIIGVAICLAGASIIFWGPRPV